MPEAVPRDRTTRGVLDLALATRHGNLRRSGAAGGLAGISAGLAFYKPEYGNGPFYGKNLEYLGLASGKISTCLRYGVPVILNKVGLYAEEAIQFRFGCVVEGPEQIKDRLDEISHEEYRHNAKDYFATKLDFNIYRDEIWSRFEALVNDTGYLGNGDIQEL